MKAFLSLLVRPALMGCAVTSKVMIRCIPMRRITVAAITVLLIVGCTGGRPLLRTERTRNKTDAEVRADISECEKQQGEQFLFGPVVAVIPLTMIIGTAKDVGLRSCLEAKGYSFGDLPPQKAKP